MSATAATAKKQKPLKRHPSKLKQASAYTILTLILISIVAVTFAFPLYWIITGSFKTGAAINSTTPEWWPHEWVLTNYQKLFAGKSAPLWQLAVPFSARFSADGDPIYFSVGPTAPAALRWMINTVFMAVMTVGIMVGLILVPLLTKRIQGGMVKLGAKDSRWADIFNNAMFLGMISAFLGYVFSDVMNVTHGDFTGLIPVFVMLTSALAMVICGVAAMRTKKRWIQDYALPISMLCGMGASIPLTSWLS